MGRDLTRVQRRPGDPNHAAGRRIRGAAPDVLLFHDPGDGAALETLSVSRYGVGDLFAKAWDKERDGDQWAHLARLIEARDPARIGVNISETWSQADGLPYTEHRLLMQALPERLRERVVSAEALAVGWLETRSEYEMALYPQIVRIAHAIIAEGLSEQVIQPGVTRTSDRVVVSRAHC